MLTELCPKLIDHALLDKGDRFTHIVGEMVISLAEEALGGGAHKAVAAHVIASLTRFWGAGGVQIKT